MEPKGILRNKDTDAPVHSPETASGELDREEVIRNTRYNAQMVTESSKGDRIRQQLAEARLKNGDDTKLSANGTGESNDHLKWDEINLYKTEQEKAATMKIDEPKTPYEGGFDPTGEYYQDDISESIPQFTLGEGRYESGLTLSRSINGSEVLHNDENNQDEDDEDDEDGERKPLLVAERHKHFEEMRQAHYHNAANPLTHKISIPGDDEALNDEVEEEEDDEDEE